MKKAEAHIKCYRKTSWENTYEHFGCDCINQIHLALSVPQQYYDTRIPAECLIKLPYPFVYLRQLEKNSLDFS